MLSPVTAIVMIGAFLAAVIVSTRPGDHTAVYTILSGFVALYLQRASEADKATEARKQSDEKLGEYHKEVNSKMTQLLKVSGAEHFLEGEKQGESQGRINEVEDERLRVVAREEKEGKPE